MDVLAQRLMMGAAGGSPPVYIEDVFSTWLYTGNGGTQTITNGIDLAGKGGLVWGKSLNDGTNSHRLQDTVRGIGNEFFTNLTNAQNVGVIGISSFNSNGFTLGSGLNNWTSNNGRNVTWTFRKQPKFFDVVTYTGDGTFPRAIPHNLGSIPGCIIIKCTSHATNWLVSHRGMSDPIGNLLNLNSTAAETGVTNGNNNNGYFSSTTSTLFYVGNNAEINAVGRTYVAYLFAHNAGGFGASGTDNVISCGSYTGNGSTLEVNLGYEAQWVFVKRINDNGDWWCADIMRGMTVGTTDSAISLNSINNENTSVNWIEPRSNGFALTNASVAQTNDVNGLNSSYIYIAIRRGPMRTPTSGTSVFSPVLQNGGTVTVTTNFPVDLNMTALPSAGGNPRYVSDRLRGGSSNSYRFLNTATSDAEISGTGAGIGFDNNTGINAGGYFAGNSVVWWNFRRAPGFFDVVCYTGTGVARTVSHNLGVAPELMIVKRRNQTTIWFVAQTVDSFATLGELNLNNTNNAGSPANFNNTLPTSSVFSIGAGSQINGSGGTFVAYLFASLPGISKVGSYTGTGSTVQVNCGFTAGARFVLIKRTDAAGDWYVWDSARGIVAGNDPYLLLNSTAAEVTNTDWVDTLATGFEVSNAGSNLVNVNGGTYLFLAIA